jgi:hypothetical protein
VVLMRPLPGTSKSNPSVRLLSRDLRCPIKRSEWLRGQSTPYLDTRDDSSDVLEVYTYNNQMRL